MSGYGSKGAALVPAVQVQDGKSMVGDGSRKERIGTGMTRKVSNRGALCHCGRGWFITPAGWGDYDGVAQCSGCGAVRIGPALNPLPRSAEGVQVITPWFGARVYGWVVRHTTGEPWTWIMRRNPAILPVILLPLAVVGAGLIVAARPALALPAMLAVAVGSFVAGHVYWGKKQTHGGEE